MRRLLDSISAKLPFLLAGWLAMTSGCAPVSKPHPMPRIVHANGRHALLVDDKPFLILGAQVNNSSGWPNALPNVWPAVEAIHANTVEIPVYWEQLEAVEGAFDFSVVDTLLQQAREHHVHLVLLWFGTWKNGANHYLPKWMKERPELSPLVQDANGKPVDSPSPYCEEACRLDQRAFAALMGHLAKVDPVRTVLMVQVENEPGTWGVVRDYSPEAEKRFRQPVPAFLLSALHKPAGATWQAAFGPDADEFFHAWSIATYVERVAAAGKAAYPLPLYVNAALRDPLQPGRPPAYESGGPTDNTIPIWKATAPSLDLLAPDIYMVDAPRYLKVLDLYQRPDNPLFIPETSRYKLVPRFFYAALAHGAIGFSPFGIDFTDFSDRVPAGRAMSPTDVESFAMNYRTCEPMNSLLAQLVFEGQVAGAAEAPDALVQTLNLNGWRAKVSYGGPLFGPLGELHGSPDQIGRTMVAGLGPDQFLVTGNNCRVEFERADGGQWRFLTVEEGQYNDGEWNRTRLWNGDQTDWGLNFAGSPQVLRVTLQRLPARNP